MVINAAQFEFQTWETTDADGHQHRFTLAELEEMAANEGAQVPIDEKRVASIVKSLVSTGKMFMPLRVASYHDGRQTTFRLVGGRHRLAAIRQVAILWNWQDADDFEVDVQMTWVSSIEEANALVINDNSSRKMSAPEIKSLSMGVGREELVDVNFIDKILSAKSRTIFSKLLTMHLHALYFELNENPKLSDVTVDRIASTVIRGTLIPALPTTAKRFREELPRAQELVDTLINTFANDLDDVVSEFADENKVTNFGRATAGISSAFIQYYGQVVKELQGTEEEETEELTTDAVHV